VYLSLPTLEDWPILNQKIFISDFNASFIDSDDEKNLIFYIPLKSIKKFQGAEKGVFKPFNDLVEKEKKEVIFDVKSIDDFIENIAPEIIKQGSNVYDLTIYCSAANSMLELQNFYQTDKISVPVADVKKILKLLNKNFNFNVAEISGRYYQFQS